MKPMKTLFRRVWALAVGVLLTAVCGASEPWTLDNTKPMPGSFWTITSPDGKWTLTCAQNGPEGIWHDRDYSADLVVVREYGWAWAGPNDEERYDNVDTEDVFGKSIDDGCVVKGSGVLTLPTQARDKSGKLYSVEIGDWSLEGWSKPVLRMTKCVVPADYTAGIGEGTSIACDFEVEEGNPKYYSKDGVLYLKEEAREDGEQGDALWQFPSGKKGTFTIPNGVTLVRIGAFEGCGLSELVIGPDLEDFGADSEVQKTLKKITIRDNGNFVFENGLLLGNGGETVVMVLHGVVGKRLVVPSSVTYVAPFAMGYLENVKEIYFISDNLTLDTYALEECETLSVIDFSSVGSLTLGPSALEDIEVKTVVLPEATSFGEGLFVEDAEIADIYWPTKKGYAESGFGYVYFEDRVRLHVRKDAGDWSSHGLNGVTILKDMVEPAKPELPAFLAEVEGVRVGVPVSGELRVADYASLKVTGLPSGIKAVSVRKNPGVVTFSGAATKEGTYQVAISYFENGRTVTKIYPLFIDKAPHLTVSAVAGPGGTVKGGGDVYAGKKMTLKATANKGYAFAGWYHDASYTRPYDGYTSSFGDYRNPNLPIVNESALDEKLDLYAKFIRAEEDASLLDLICEEVYYTSGAFDLPLEVQSLSLPKVALSGLPPGVKFDAKANRISGTATKPGSYVVSAKLTNATVKKPVVRAFTIVVDNLTGANGAFAEPLANARGERYSLAVGVGDLSALPSLSLASGSGKLAVSGLPSGLKYNAKTGKIEGVPSKAGVYTVYLAVTEGRAKKISTLTIDVAPLPEWAIGSFQGDNDMVYAKLEVSANGNILAELYGDYAVGRWMANRKAKITAKSFSGYDEGVYTLEFVADAVDMHNSKDRRRIVGSLQIFADSFTEAGDKIGVCSLIVEWEGKDLEMEDESLEIMLCQDVFKRKNFKVLPKFAGKGVTVRTSHAIEDGSGEGITGTSSQTLVISADGKVAWSLSDEEYEPGSPRPIVTTAKQNVKMVVYEYDERERVYYGRVSFHRIDEDKDIETWWYEIEMGVGEDGLIHEGDCKVVDSCIYWIWD